MRDTSLQLEVGSWARRNTYELLWRAWSQNYSVFNPETGETHLVSELPAAVLRLIAQEPRPLPHIAAKLAGICGVEMTTAWERKIVGVLTNLEQIELVEQIHAERH
jgi:PqqD family protein of HPr-rel-A system